MVESNILLSSNRVSQVELTRILFEIERQWSGALASDSKFLYQYSEKLATHASFIFAIDNEAVVGLCAFYDNDPKGESAYISYIALKTDYQNRGIGLQILRAVEEKMKEKGFCQYRLEVKKSNKKTLRFYLRNGLEIDGDASVNSYYMKKIIR